MLRITPARDHDAALTLRLEGKLTGPWVGELARSCEAASCPPDRLRLDLAALSYADGPGVALLRRLAVRGARLVACSGLVAELLREEGC